MKISLIISCVFILIGCNKISEPIEKPYLGFWVNTAYLKEVKQTKSTKKSQEIDPLSIINLYQENGKTWGQQIWNFHDGGAPLELKMKSSNIAELKFENVKTATRIDFESDSILKFFSAEGIKTFKKYEGGIVPNYPVNEILFVNNYLLNGKDQVRFTPKGQVIGTQSINSYRVNIDYMDAGMQLDKIYLRENGKEKEEVYGYEFRSDTLNIFELECNEFDASNSMCMVITKGKLKYWLVTK